MKNNKLNIIVIYRSKNISLSKLIASIEAERIILSANSPDSSLSKISTTDACVIYNNKVNKGYGGGINSAIEISKSKREWYICINQDIKLTKSSYEKFIEILDTQNPSIVGPFGGYLDDRRWTTVETEESTGHKNSYVSGSFMAVHRDVVDSIGMFYEPYFMYYEDVDFCIRARRAGFPVIHSPMKGISHEGSASIGLGSYAQEYYLARNHLLFVERHAPAVVKVHEAARLPKTILEHKLKGNSGGMRGVGDYLLRRFGKLEDI